MSFATVAPGQSNVPGGPTGPPVCQNCSTSTTPLWRRDESGTVLCNACGLFLKLHGRPRPISLKTDTIKSRNRLKTSIPSIAAAQQSQLSQQQPVNNEDLRPTKRKSLPAAHPDASSHTAAAQAQAAAQAAVAQQRQGSRSGTPSNVNIAPQAMFDSAILDTSTAMLTHSSYGASGDGTGATGATGSTHILSPSLRHPSPMSAELSQRPDSIERLKTRVSELEVINDLFRGRVAELERSEESARALAVELQSRVRELERERELAGLGPISTSDTVGSGSNLAEPASKRQRLDNEDRNEADGDGDGELNGNGENSMQES